MKTYRVPIRGDLNTWIDVKANSEEEAIELSYKEMDNDTSIFGINFYCDTYEDEVEEVDVEGEKREYEEMRKLIEEHRRLKEEGLL